MFDIGRKVWRVKNPENVVPRSTLKPVGVPSRAGVVQRSCTLRSGVLGHLEGDSDAHAATRGGASRGNGSTWTGCSPGENHHPPNRPVAP